MLSDALVISKEDLGSAVEQYFEIEKNICINNCRCLMRENALRYNHTKMGHIITTCAVIQNFLIKNHFDITDIPITAEADDPGENTLNAETLVFQDDNYLMIGNDVRNNLILKITSNA